MFKVKDIQAIRQGTISADELLEKYPAKTLVSNLLELTKLTPEPEPVVLKEEEKAKPIAVSQEEFDRIVSLFRVKGLTATGEVSRRGRPSKKNTEE